MVLEERRKVFLVTEIRLFVEHAKSRQKSIILLDSSLNLALVKSHALRKIGSASHFPGYSRAYGID